MSTPYLIRRSDIIAAAPKRWAEQYGKGHYAADPKKQDITRALAALDLGTINADAVDAIIGNTSWTANECDVCHKNCDVLMHFGDEPDYEAQYAHVCGDCLRAAVHKIDGAA